MFTEVTGYIESGWNVIPISKETKTPLCKWVEYQTERQDLDFVKRWFLNGKANVAIITGAISGLVALDVDVKSGGSVKDMMEKYPSGLVAMTPSGGCHIYFKHPGVPVQNRVGIFKGCDLRGDGGFCHAAPSEYKNGKYEWLFQGEPSECPPEFYSASEESSHERVNADDWISSTLEYGAKEGERNSTLSKLAGFFASKDIPQDISILLLKNWNTKNTSRLSPSEIETTVKSVYKTTNRKSLSKTPRVNAPTGSFGGKDFSLMNLDEFMYQWGDQPVDWIIRDWLPDKTIGMIISPPGSYKTWTTIDLALSVATGKPFMGMYSVNPEKVGPVFLIQQEDFAGQTAQRITLVRRAKYKDEQLPVVNEEGEIELAVPEKIPLYIHPDRKLNLEDAGAMHDLEEAIKTLKPKLIIVDPLYSLGGTDDFMASLAKDMFIFKDYRDKYGVSFMIAHHTNKGQAVDRMRAWGSQFINAFLETGWQIEPKGDRSIKIRRHFKSSQNIEAINLSFNIDDKETWTYEVHEGLVDSTDKDEEKVSTKNDDKPKRGPGRPPKSIKLDPDTLPISAPTKVGSSSLPKNPFKKILNKQFHPEQRKNLMIQRWLQDLVVAPVTDIPEYEITKVPFVEGGTQVKDWEVTLHRDSMKRNDNTQSWTKFEIFRIIAQSDIGIPVEQLALVLNRSIDSTKSAVKFLYDTGVLEKYDVNIDRKDRVAYRCLSTIDVNDLIIKE